MGTSTARVWVGRSHHQALLSFQADRADRRIYNDSRGIITETTNRLSGRLGGPAPLLRGVGTGSDAGQLPGEEGREDGTDVDAGGVEVAGNADDCAQEKMSDQAILA